MIPKEFILITSSNFPKGGSSATYLNLFCRGLKLNGYNIRVVLLKGFSFGNYEYDKHRKGITEDGIQYKYLGFSRRPRNLFLKIVDDIFIFSSLLTFLPLILKCRKSISLIVYNNEAKYNIPIYLFSKFFKIKIITFVPEFYDKSIFDNSPVRILKWYSFLFNFYCLNKLSTKLIVFSSFLKDEYLKMGFSENKIFVQPNLTDFKFWEVYENNIRYTLGYSGTPYIKDGLYDLFKAISILQKEDFAVSLLVIGDSLFGKSLIPSLKLECEKLEILDRVTFTGLQESTAVKEYLSQCRILTITRPSILQTKAGFPTKLGEYFAVRRPILSTDFGEITRYFTDGLDLVIAESGNPDSIAQRIKKMLQNLDELNDIMNQGYLKAKGIFDYQISIKRIINFLNN